MKWPFGVESEEEDVDVDTYMKELTMGTGKLPEEEDTNVYLKSIKVASEEDVEKVSKELRKGNLIVVNLGGLFSEKGKLRIVIEKVKGVVEETEGDICRVSKEKLLLVPKGMEIVA